MSQSTNILITKNDKEQNIQIARSFINDIKEGNIHPLEALTYIKSIEHIVELFTDNKNETAKEFKTLVADEAQKHGKTFTYANTEFQVKEAGVKYDYTICGDTTLNEMYATLKTLQEDIKEREAMLRALPEKGLADPENGNMLYPPLKTSTTIVQCKIK